MARIMQPEERTGWIHLDPRTKLVILVAFSIVVMIDITDGPASVIRTIMTFVPVVLIVAEGKYHIGVWFTILYILSAFLMHINANRIGGVVGMIILFLASIVMQFAPLMMAVWYCISTTKISEFMAAMNRMHMHQGVTISIAVMMRFFPTLKEESLSIRDAMKMRGIQFGKGNPLKAIEFRLIPLLFSSVNIGDELSAAAVTRGLGAPVRRTNVCEIGFRFLDFVLIAILAALTGLYLYFSLSNGVIFA
ncbi:MAG: energy-coupling factor transporter transmembrane component T [Eubacterium sp.]|nr:energy-coupling factor transporter transmembrane component T [Eubacterium sp.]